MTMPEKWTGVLVGKMHNARVTYDDLANELGVGKAYICMILNGQRKPPNAKERLNEAFERVIERRKLWQEKPQDIG